MRRIPKFKILTKTGSIFLSVPKKILKFNHSKWKLLKTKVFKFLKRRCFFNFSLVSTKLKRWEKRKLFFKNKLFLKREFYQLYDSSLKYKNLKKFLNVKQVKSLDNIKYLSLTLLRVEYKIDNLLTKLKLFSNIYLTRQKINIGDILVNEMNVTHNYVLKKGDIVTFLKKTNPQNILTSQFNSFFFIPFVEVDFYTSTIVVIKSPVELSNQDLSLFFVKHFNSHHISNLIN